MVFLVNFGGGYDQILRLSSPGVLQRGSWSRWVVLGAIFGDLSPHPTNHSCGPPLPSEEGIASRGLGLSPESQARDLALTVLYMVSPPPPPHHARPFVAVLQRRS